MKHPPRSRKLLARTALSAGIGMLLAAPGVALAMPPTTGRAIAPQASVAPLATRSASVAPLLTRSAIVTKLVTPPPAATRDRVPAVRVGNGKYASFAQTRETPNKKLAGR